MAKRVSGRAPSGQALAVPAEPKVSALTGFDPSRELGLMPEQVANLRKLSAYLRTLPADYPDFEMNLYCQDGDGYGCDIAHLPACGTAACAVGHGPAAGIKPLIDEKWAAYAKRAFAEDDAFRWCFDECWTHTDNTVHGAADRIDWMLARGLPENAHEQRWGDDPLCYRAQVSGQ